MFIELTDHLRCPADHPEGFLVLLPGRMAGRRVLDGTLGCPACGRETAIAGGVAEFGDPPAVQATVLTAEAVAAFAGLEGPGGYLALVGGAARLADSVRVALPGIRLVLVNPPAGTTAAEADSVLRSDRWPLKSRCLRTAVVARDHAAWGAVVGASVLPGNRLIVEGPAPDLADYETAGEGGGVWVGRRLTAPRR